MKELFRYKAKYRSFERVCVFQSQMDDNSSGEREDSNEKVVASSSSPPQTIVRHWDYLDSNLGCEIWINGLKCMSCVKKVRSRLLQEAEKGDFQFSVLNLVHKPEGTLHLCWNHNEMTKAQQINLLRNCVKGIEECGFEAGMGVLPITIEWEEYEGGYEPKDEPRVTMQEAFKIEEASSPPPHSMDASPSDDQLGHDDAQFSTSEKAPLIQTHSSTHPPSRKKKRKNFSSRTTAPPDSIELPITSIASSIACEAKFEVLGMHCSSCVGKVEDAVKAMSTGIIKCSVSLMAQEAKVEYNADAVSSSDIESLISELGFKCRTLEVLSPEQRQHAPKKTTLHLNIHGMHCASCVSKVEDHVSKMDGISSASVSLMTNSARVEYQPNLVGARQIIAQIESIGFGASLAGDSADGDSAQLSSLNHSASILSWKRRTLLSFLLVAPVVLLTIFDRFFYGPKVSGQGDTSGLHLVDILVWILSTPVQFYAGWHFHRGAFKSLRHGYADMNVLISLGTMAAYFSSVFFLLIALLFPSFSVSMYYFETAAMIIAFQSLGKYLETLAKGRTSTAITSLMKLQAKQAVLVEVEGDKIEGGMTSSDDSIMLSSTTSEIDTNLLQVGDLVKVFPGATIPSDGTVFSGHSMVNESMLTGESLSVPKNKGDSVFGGTINEDGVLFVRISRVGQDSMLSQIVRLVKDAQSSKAPIQRYADRISKVFVPFIIAVALAAFVLWFSASLTVIPKEWIPSGSNAFLFSLAFPMAILVIACPCALGLATPTAVLVATGIGARMGVLIKGGEALETSHNITAVVFDKTGTLTEGRPSVVKYQIFDKDETTYEEYFSTILSAEQNSEHPIGRALVEYARHHTERRRGVESFSIIPGKGLFATLRNSGNGQQQQNSQNKSTDSSLDHVIIGTRKLMEQHEIIIPKRRSLNKQEQLARTVVLVAVNGKCVGYVAVQDKPREESARVIQKLHSMGIETYMLSGDQKISVDAMQKKLGVQHAFAQVLPEDKVKVVKRLKKQGHQVCMVGDGVNDSPALAEASLGMAIGAGTDIAIQSADVVLVRNDLRGILVAIDLSRTTYKRIKLNHFWALGYNILFVPLACGVMFPFFQMTIPPLMAACTMIFSSILVITSSLMLRFYRAPVV